MTRNDPRRLLNSVSLLATERATFTLARMSATHEYSPRSESSFSARPTYSSRRVLAAEPDRSVDEAARLMAREQVRRLPVQEHGRLVGMVSLGDVAVRPDYTMEAGEVLQEISQNIRRV